MQIRSTPFAIAVMLAVVPRALAVDSPEETLAQLGLREERGRWVLAEEHRLARLLKRVDGHVRSFRKTGQAWREQIDRVNALEKERERLETQYEENRRLLQQRAGNALLVQQLNEQQGRISQRLGDLRLNLKRQQNESESELYEAARGHAAARAELAAVAAAIRDTHTRLTARYDSLQALREVSDALAALRATTTADHQLGAAETYRGQVEQALKQIARLLEADELPLMVSGGWPQIGVVVDGLPATFVIDEKHSPTLVPLSEVERLGISIPETGQWHTLRYGEQELRIFSARLAELRLGSARLAELPVFVTDRQHGDLGARLGSDAVDQLGLRIDSSRARVDVRK